MTSHINGLETEMHDSQTTSTMAPGHYAITAYPAHAEKGGRPRLEFTAPEISDIQTQWMAGVSINDICARHHAGTERVRRLADENGWAPRTPSSVRDALPAGHSVTWALLWQGSPLAGIAYPEARGA